MGGNSGPVGLAAAQDAGPLGARVLHQAAHPLDRRRAHQRPDLGGRVARVANGQLARLGRQRGGELVGHGGVGHDALGGHADLALVHERAELGGRHRLVQVGVGQDHQRRLAAQLQQHALEVAGRVLGDQPAHARGAGEVDPAHGRVGDQLVDHVGGGVGLVGHQVHRAVGQPGVVQRLGDRRVRARAHLRRLQDHGVAEGQRGGHGARAQDHRRVPGRDAHHHARGPAHRHRGQARHVGRDHLAGHGGGLGRGLLEHAGGQVAVEHAPAERAAGLGGHDRGDVLRALAQQGGRLLQRRAPRGRGSGRPLAEGGRGGVDRGLRVLATRCRG